jgi:hypothetical protein
MVKQFAETPGLVEAQRRYSPAPFIGVKIKVKAGAPRRDRICTSHVERQNLTVRHFNKRFARLPLIQQLAANKLRDRLVTKTLRRQGWIVLRIWEHDLSRNEIACVRRIKFFLPGDQEYRKACS